MPRSPRILLTGATGHLGAAILAECGRRQDPPSLRLLVRSPQKLERLRQLDRDAFHLLDACDVRCGDLRDRDAVRAAVDGVDVLCHAAYSHEYWRGTSYLRQANQLAIDHLLDACRETGTTRRIVAVGSYSAHHPTSDPPSDSELEPLAPREYNSKAKATILHHLASESRRLGLELAVISPSYMIGPYQLDPTYFGALFHLVLFRPLRWAPPHGINLVDVRDVARHTVDLMLAEGEQRVLATGDNVLFTDLFGEMNRTAGWSAVPKTLSPALLRRLPRLRLFGRFGQRYFDRPHFVEEPGLSDPVHSLRSSVADAVEWARNQELFRGTFDVLRFMIRRYL